MKPDSEGFLYPVIDDSLCTECGLCRTVCPANAPLQDDARSFVPAVYAAWCDSDEVRLSSTSGGVFSALCEDVISRDGTIYGCAFDDELSAHHGRATQIEECHDFRGSKYSQSVIGTSYQDAKRDLQQGIPVLFSGTPCQIAGLKGFLGSKRPGLVTADVVCHGVPSPGLFAEHLDFLSATRGSLVAEYQHRPKDVGWGHNEKIVFADGAVEIRTPLADSWRKLFYSEVALRPSCYQCRFASIRRVSDITLGDYWGVGLSHPELADNPLGISLVLINSEAGAQALARARGLRQVESTADACLIRQPQLQHPPVRPANRERFWSDYSERGYAYVLRRYDFYNIKIRVRRALRVLAERLHMQRVIKLAMGVRMLTRGAR